MRAALDAKHLTFGQFSLFDAIEISDSLLIAAAAARILLVTY
jgi:hypothetical protein